MRVLDPLTDCGDEVPPSLAEATERVAARAAPAGGAGRPGGHGVPTSAAVVVKGRQETPAHAIMRHAEERRARLIAMATDGGGLLRRVALGSVAVGVLSETQLPVLMAGPRVRPPREILPYRVLVTTDDSSAAILALPALQRVLERAPSDDVEVALVRVHEAAFDERPPAVALAESERGMAWRGLLPALVGRVWSTRGTPRVAIFLVTTVSLLFALTGSISFVAQVTNFAVFTLFIVVNGALIRLRVSQPDQRSRFERRRRGAQYRCLHSLGWRVRGRSSLSHARRREQMQRPAGRIEEARVHPALAPLKGCSHGRRRRDPALRDRR